MRSLLGGLFFIAATSYSAFAQSTGAYDLMCSGTLTPTTVSGAPDPQASSQSYTTHLSVDLDHRTFCQDECKAQEVISKILPADIVFRSSPPPQLQRFWMADDGQFSNTWVEERSQGSDKTYIVMSARGSCVKSPKIHSEANDPITVKPTPQREAVVEREAREPATSSSAPLGFSEISALIDIKNHRPVAAKLHMELQNLGYIRLQDDLWTLTAKAEVLVSGGTK
jgi:hypothetical protein